VTDAHTEVWKGRTFHDLSPVQVGDDLSARCYRDASGKLVADVIWLHIVNFFAVLKWVTSLSPQLFRLTAVGLPEDHLLTAIGRTVVFGLQPGYQSTTEPSSES
jgi:hypothetical protein